MKNIQELSYRIEILDGNGKLAVFAFAESYFRAMATLQKMFLKSKDIRINREINNIVVDGKMKARIVKIYYNKGEFVTSSETEMMSFEWVEEPRSEIRFQSKYKISDTTMLRIAKSFDKIRRELSERAYFEQMARDAAWG